MLDGEALADGSKGCELRPSQMMWVQEKQREICHMEGEVVTGVWEGEMAVGKLQPTMP